MRHKKKRFRIGTGKDHRRLLIAGLLTDLITHRRLKTTLTKAKVIKANFDKLVTLSKRNNLHSYRLLIARLGNNKTAAYDLVHKILPRLSDRHSGYTSLRRLNQRRGDNAMMAEVKILLGSDKANKTKKEAQQAALSKDKKTVKTKTVKSVTSSGSKTTPRTQKTMKSRTFKSKASKTAGKRSKSGDKDAK